ncbi:HAD family hydrolase [Agaribacterium sp. ZY112]|uniref:HAD family hydrolase n=1 Tax=Agaribacterium sp. ZY112 TaxID=3233574 RepID=UPI0035235457
MNDQIELVVFDLFGTLFQYSVRHHPFDQILRAAKDGGRKPRADDARILMTTGGRIEDIFAALDILPSKEQLNEFSQLVGLELEGLSLFDDVSETLTALQDQGKKIAICSNLAQPYGKALNVLLPNLNALIFLSYEVGLIKPEFGIYQWIEDQSGICRNKTLFIGDTYEADYKGPIEFGFKAKHLVRNKPTSVDQIRSLLEIIQ